MPLDRAVAALVDEWSMVAYVALDYSDEDSVGDVLAQVSHDHEKLGSKVGADCRGRAPMTELAVCQRSGCAVRMLDTDGAATVSRRIVGQHMRCYIVQKNLWICGCQCMLLQASAAADGGPRGGVKKMWRAGGPCHTVGRRRGREGARLRHGRDGR